MMILIVFTGIALLRISQEDYKYRRIPNLYLIMLIILRSLMIFKLPLAFENIQSAVFILIAFWYPYEKRWIGAGDVKYLMVAVLFFQKEDILYGLIGVFLLGGILCAFAKWKFQCKKVPYSYPITITLMVFFIGRLLWMN